VPVIFTVFPLMFAKQACLWNPVIYIFFNPKVSLTLEKVSEYLEKSLNGPEH
jgi:hypothetical protein